MTPANTSEETTRFMTTAFSEVPADAYVLVWTLPDKRSAFFTTVGAATTYVVDRCDRQDVYFGLGLRGADLGPTKRGGNDAVVALVGFGLDLDVADPVHAKPNLPPDRAAAFDLIEALPLPPTLVIDSGHGLQAFWFFAEPYVFADAADRRHVAAISHGWQRRAREGARRHGWDVDATGDLARVFRIGGTWNRKAQPVPVRVVREDGPRYAGPDAFSEFVVIVEEPEPEAADCADGELVLDPEAEPPLEHFAILYARNKRFRESWERTRADLVDQSPSGYDQSLASLAAAAGWGDQQITDLVIASRRKHHNDLKLRRQDYYAATLRKARAGRGQAQALAEATADGPADDPAQIRQRLNRLLGLTTPTIDEMLQHGREQARFTLVLSDGTRIPLGTADELLSARAVRSRLYEASTITLPMFKTADWIEVATQLKQITRVIENPDATRHATLFRWLGAYLGDANVAGGARYKDAVSECDPFLRDGHLYLHAETLRRFVSTATSDRVASAELHDRLRAAGFDRREVSVRPEQRGPLSRSYWAAPLALLAGLGLALNEDGA